MSGVETVDVAAMRARAEDTGRLVRPRMRSLAYDELTVIRRVAVASLADIHALLDALDVRTRERDEARDTLARVTKTAEHAIHVHAQVVMDTPEDRDLHDRAVQALRDHLRAALGDGRGQG